MPIIMNSTTREVLAVTDTPMEAEIVMRSLVNAHEYDAYERMGSYVQHGADVNKWSIIDSLRVMASAHKIFAIKTYRAIYGVGLTEAKAVIEGANPSY